MAVFYKYNEEYTPLVRKSLQSYICEMFPVAREIGLVSNVEMRSVSEDVGKGG